MSKHGYLIREVASGYDVFYNDNQIGYDEWKGKAIDIAFDHACTRAEAAEADLQAVMTRAAQAEAERDAAWLELREIRRLIDADKDESTLDEVTRKLYRLSKDAHDAEQETNKLHERTRQAEAERDELRTKLNESMAIARGFVAERDEARRQLAEAVDAEREAILSLANELEFKPSKWSDLLTAIRAR